MPVLKLAGFCCVLACIAWLGERSRDETIYGPELKEASAHAQTGSESEGAASATKPLEAKTSQGEAGPGTSAPAVLPSVPCSPGAQSGPPTPAASALLADGRLVLNEASAQELDRLPGIGQKRAEDIVALRTRLGRFRRIQDLLRIRGIGPRSLASLQEHLALDRPPVPAAGGTGGSSGAGAPGSAAPPGKGGSADGRP